MRLRRTVGLSVVAVVAVVASALVAALALDGRDAARAVGASPLDPPAFVVHAGIESMWLEPPGDPDDPGGLLPAYEGLDVTVRDGADAIVATVTTNDRGAAFIDGLVPGDGFTVELEGIGTYGAVDPFEVLAVDGGVDADVYPAGWSGDAGCELGAASALYCQDLDEGFSYVEVRDGTELAAYVQFPDEPMPAGGYPTLVEYSLYDPSMPFANPLRTADAFLSAGYAVVGVNTRGTACSGGVWDLLNVREAYDGYDVIETIASQAWSNGKVGMTGTSGPGMTALHTAHVNPPSLGAIAVGGVTADGYPVAVPGGIRNGYVKGWAAQMDLASSHLDGAPAEFWIRRLFKQDDVSMPNPSPYHPYDNRFGSGNPFGIEDSEKEACRENHRLRSFRVPIEPALGDVEYENEPALAALTPLATAGEIDAPTMLYGGWQDSGEHGSIVEFLEEMQPGTARAVMANGTHHEADSPASITTTLELMSLFVRQKLPDEAPAERDALDPEVYDSNMPRTDPLGDESHLGTQGITLRGFDAEDVALPSHHNYGANLAVAQQAWHDEAAAEPMIILWENGAGTSPVHPFDGQPEGSPSVNADGSLAYPTFATQHTAWPPSEAGGGADYYLQTDGALAPGAGGSAPGYPAGDDSSTFDYDPAAYPANSTRGGIDEVGVLSRYQPYAWQTLPSDAADAESTSRSVTFETPAFDAPTLMAGPAYAELWVTSTMDNVDLGVTVSEVRPDGSEVLMQSAYQRTTFRTLAETSGFGLQPDVRYDDQSESTLSDVEARQVWVPITPFSHVLRDGSSLRLTVKAPGGDESLWTFTGFDYTGDGQPDDGMGNVIRPDGDTTVTLTHDAAHPSRVVLPVLDTTGMALPDPFPGLSRCGALRSQPCRHTGSQQSAPWLEATAGVGGATDLAVSWDAEGRWNGLAADLERVETGGNAWAPGRLQMTLTDPTWEIGYAPVHIAHMAPGTIPAAAGEDYQGSVEVWGSSEVSVTPTVAFFDDTGQSLTMPELGQGQLPPSASPRWLSSDLVTAPAGTAFVSFGVLVEGDVGEVVYLDSVHLHRGATPATDRQTHNLIDAGASTFEHPLDGGDLTAFRVTAERLDDEAAPLEAVVAAGTTEHVFANVGAGVWEAHITAINSVGEGLASPTSPVVAPMDVNAEPAGANAAMVSWDPVGDPGDVAQYEVIGPHGSLWVSGDETQLRVSHLIGGEPVSFRVRPHFTAWGTSEPSAPSNDVVPQADRLHGLASGMDIEPWGWRAENQDLAVTTDQARSGPHSLRAEVTGRTNTAILPVDRADHQFPVAPGEDMVASAWLRTESASRQVAPVLVWFNDAWGVVGVSGGISTVTTIDDISWTEVTVEGEAPDGAAYAAFVISYADAVIGDVSYADDASLRRGTLAAPDAVELLSSATRTLDASSYGWNPTNASTVIEHTTTDPAEGTGALDIETGSAGAAVRSEWFTNTNIWSPHEAGFQAQASVRSAAVSRDATISLVWVDDQGAELGRADGTAVASTTSDWQTVSVAASPPANTNGFYVEISFLGAALGENHRIDAGHLCAGSDTCG